MPVTTRHQTGGLLAGSSSDRRDEAHEPVWDELESDVFVFEEESNDSGREGSDDADIDDDFEGTFNTIRGHTSC